MAKEIDSEGAIKKRLSSDSDALLPGAGVAENKSERDPLLPGAENASSDGAQRHHDQRSLLNSSIPPSGLNGHRRSAKRARGKSRHPKLKRGILIGLVVIVGGGLMAALS